VSGGSARYIEAIRQLRPFDVRLNSPVQQLIRSRDHVTVGIRKQNHRRLVGQREISHNGTIVLVERSNSAMVTRESAASVAA
jgi:hypothetical protein